MAEYRLYLLDGAGQFAGAEWISADSDEQALAIAQGLGKSLKAEVWQGARLVAEVASSDAAIPGTGTPDRIPQSPEAPQGPEL